MIPSKIIFKTSPEQILLSEPYFIAQDLINRIEKAKSSSIQACKSHPGIFFVGKEFVAKVGNHRINQDHFARHLAKILHLESICLPNIEADIVNPPLQNPKERIAVSCAIAHVIQEFQSQKGTFPCSLSPYIIHKKLGKTGFEYVADQKILSQVREDKAALLFLFIAVGGFQDVKGEDILFCEQDNDQNLILADVEERGDFPHVVYDQIYPKFHKPLHKETILTLRKIVSYWDLEELIDCLLNYRFPAKEIYTLNAESFSSFTSLHSPKSSDTDESSENSETDDYEFGKPDSDYEEEQEPLSKFFAKPSETAIKPYLSHRNSGTLSLNLSIQSPSAAACAFEEEPSSCSYILKNEHGFVTDFQKLKDENKLQTPDRLTHEELTRIFMAAQNIKENILSQDRFCMNDLFLWANPFYENVQIALDVVKNTNEKDLNEDDEKKFKGIKKIIDDLFRTESPDLLIARRWHQEKIQKTLDQNMTTICDVASKLGIRSPSPNPHSLRSSPISDLSPDTDSSKASSTSVKFCFSPFIPLTLSETKLTRSDSSKSSP